MTLRPQFCPRHRIANGWNRMKIRICFYSILALLLLHSPQIPWTSLFYFSFFIFLAFLFFSPFPPSLFHCLRFFFQFTSVSDSFWTNLLLEIRKQYKEHLEIFLCKTEEKPPLANRHRGMCRSAQDFFCRSGPHFPSASDLPCIQCVHA